MKGFERERLDNAISYFAREFRAGAGKNLPSMGLYKFLALVDHWSVRTTGKPAFNLTYRAMKMGPVPLELYENVSKLQSSLFSIVPKGENRFEVVSTQAPDMDYFSEAEAGEMKRLIQIFADRSMNTILFSESTHEVIDAWRRTFKTNPNGIMDFALTFPGDIYEKNQDSLTPEEDHFLLYLGLKGLHATRNGS